MSEIPPRTAAPARRSDSTARVWFPRSTAMWPPIRMYQPKTGIRNSSCFAMKRTVRGSRETSARMSSALSWLDAKMSGPSGSGGSRASVTRAPASFRIDRDQANRASHIARSPRRRRVSGRLTRKNTTMETAV